MTSPRLVGRTAVVTGGAGGLGRAFAHVLAAQGARIVVSDLGVTLDGSGSEIGRAEAVAQEVRDLGGEAIADTTDVADFDAVGRAVTSWREAFGNVDIVVHAAGILRHGSAFDLSIEDWDAVLGVHLRGGFNLIRHASPHMVERRWGRIVLISSGAAMGSARRINYATAKMALIGLTYSAARDLGPFGVNVNAVLPGVTDTRMVAATLALARREIAAKGSSTDARLMSFTPAPPEDLAPLVAYLCTDEAAGVNGQAFNADGGTYGLWQPPVITRQMRSSTRWTVDELIDAVPAVLTAGVDNPAPPTT